MVVFRCGECGLEILLGGEGETGALDAVVQHVRTHQATTSKTRQPSPTLFRFKRGAMA